MLYFELRGFGNMNDRNIRWHDMQATVLALVSLTSLPVAMPRHWSVSAQTAATAFVHVAVVPMDRERVLLDQTVIVHNGRITTIGPATQIRIPVGMARIDGQGQYLIPGLADMHAHVPAFAKIKKGIKDGAVFVNGGMEEAERMLFLYLANGITTVRIMYGWPETLDLRARAARGDLLSPRIYAAAGPFDRANLSSDSVVILVNAAKAAGYDFIKIGDFGLRGAGFDTLMVAARRVGIPVAGHMVGTVEQALRAGYASIEHLWGYPVWGSPATAAEMQSLAEATKRAGVWNCPTIVNNTWGQRDWQAWSEMRFRQNRPAVSTRVASDTSPKPGRPDVSQSPYHRMTKALHDAGAGLLLGSDAGTPWMIPGFSIHRELAGLVEAGLTPYEALVTGTRNVATFFGTQDSVGTIAVGKRADLILLSGNPLQDIHRTTGIVGVMHDGRWLSRADLDARLRKLEGTLE